MQRVGDPIQLGGAATVGKPPVQSDQSSLVDRVKLGDTAAFEELYRLHCGRIFATCLRLSGDRDRAEELTQEVFLKLWTKISRFDGRSAFSTWLYRLCVNLVIDHLRVEKRTEHWVTTGVELESRPDPKTGPSPHLTAALEEAILRLPKGARVSFVLHDIEGYRHAEIGKMAGIAVGTSKAQLHRARKLLREMLG